MSYESPYGKPRGLARRLRAAAAEMGTNRSLWRGLGIIEDLTLSASILNNREWLERLRTSNDPLAQQFATELLDEVDDLQAITAATEAAQAIDEDDPATAITALDGMAQNYQAVRDLLVDLGAIDPDDEETPVVDLLRALLS